jgi:hypothetical protein
MNHVKNDCMIFVNLSKISQLTSSNEIISYNIV